MINDYHDYHLYRGRQLDPNCHHCRIAYDNHDCHLSPEDGCAGCVAWQEARNLPELAEQKGSYIL